MIRRTPFARRALLPLGISVCLLLTAQAALAAPGSRLWLSRYDGPARGTDNVMYPILEAARAYATLGEMCDALRLVWGEYEEAPSF